MTRQTTCRPTLWSKQCFEEPFEFCRHWCNKCMTKHCHFLSLSFVMHSAAGHLCMFWDHCCECGIGENQHAIRDLISHLLLDCSFDWCFFQTVLGPCWHKQQKQCHVWMAQWVTKAAGQNAIPCWLFSLTVAFTLLLCQFTSALFLPFFPNNCYVRFEFWAKTHRENLPSFFLCFFSPSCWMFAILNTTTHEVTDKEKQHHSFGSFKMHIVPQKL